MFAYQAPNLSGRLRKQLPNSGLKRVPMLPRSSQPLVLLLRGLLLQNGIAPFSTLRRGGRRGGVMSELQEISNDLDERQERYQAAQQQGASEVTSSAPSTPVYPRGYYPPDEEIGYTMFLEKLLVASTPLAAPTNMRVDSTTLTLPLSESTSLRKNLEAEPKNTTTPSQAEGLFWWWVSKKVITVQEFQDLREDRLLSNILGQRDLRIEFAHLTTEGQLHSVMEGLRQQSKSNAHDERGCGSVKPGTVHRKAVK
ncbi:Hypothetical protein PHPALM_4051 [Phytophthora palmivora]|uniref:ATP-binding cassette (ABC) Superfamily n=1 Tax=Phytophthora palmivora TaxID=4796 RepID=A0A2P4YKT7_9STRA|nr:Hypothetical protein PHPALM_4051 [Phytophthora palmivora]